MPKVHPDQVLQLLKLAHKATKGKWRADVSNPDDVVLWGDDTSRYGGLLANVGSDANVAPQEGASVVAFDMASENARYMEAASPENLVPVLEEFERLQSENEFLKQQLDKLGEASDKYTLQLNKYQRDNLLWLLNACGFPAGQGVEPFLAANTGDWLGEIAWQLSKTGKLEEGDHPNISLEDLKWNAEFRMNNKP